MIKDSFTFLAAFP